MEFEDLENIDTKQIMETVLQKNQHLNTWQASDDRKIVNMLTITPIIKTQRECEKIEQHVRNTIQSDQDKVYWGASQLDLAYGTTDFYRLKIICVAKDEFLELAVSKIKESNLVERCHVS